MKDVLKRARAILATATATSAEEEFAYFVAKVEIEEGTYSEGLMDKAFALVGQHGDAKHAKYMELRAAQLMGDAHEYLKRLKSEWTERIKQEEVLERNRELAQQKAEFDQYKQELDSEFQAVSLYNTKAQIEEKLTPLKQVQDKALDNKNQMVVIFFCASMFLIPAFALKIGNGRFQDVMAIGIIFTVIGIIPFINLWRNSQKQDDTTLHQLETELSKVDSKLQQYELKLKAHRGYYET